MHVSTLVRWGAVLTAVGLMATACSDAPLAPSGARGFSAAGGTAVYTAADNQGRGRGDVTAGVFSQDLVVDPTQPTTLQFGSHSVYFPANSICDPATSGYGEDLWDAPCSPLQTPITIHATWAPKYGHASIDFQPALRFVPSSDPSQWVRITMKDYTPLDASYGYPIFWQRPSDGLWVDEALNDPTMASSKDPQANTVTRRIKHFSSYWVGAGESCTISLDSDSCLSTSGFTGYLLGG
ncbi:MAG TPA: hypothetical protein VJU87_06175 [Gemmatimonadaceae bacterium]|nr:hypothetical protein [Gemmatimonadaceae bacterium]